MPLVTERFQEGMPARILPTTEAPRPAALDLAAAAFRQSNIVSSAYERLSGPDRPTRIQPGYDPLSDIAGYEDHANRFIYSESPEETHWIKERIRLELRDKDVIHRGGGWGLVSSVAAGAVDPATLISMAIPVAAPATWGTRLQRVGAGVGGQIALDTASESALHSMQETRTLKESAFNIGAGTVLTGTLGAIATRVPKSEFTAVADKLRTELEEPVESSVGAMRVKDTTLDDETIVKGGVFIAKTIGKINPVLRALTAPVVETRRLVQELVPVSVQLKKNQKGLGTANSVEARSVDRMTTKHRRSMGEWEQAYMAYHKRVGKDAVSFREFGEQVSRAARRLDESDIPEVAGVAKALRKIVWDPDLKDLQKVGAIGEDVDLKGAKSYFPRVMNHEKMKRGRSEFEEMLRRHFNTGSAFVEPAEVEEAVQAVVDSYLGTVRGIAHFGDVPGVPAPLKARALEIPDELLEPWLVSDLEYVLTGYLRSVSPQIEMRRAFGSIDLKNEFDDIRRAYAAKEAKATSNEAKEKLRLRAEEDIRDLMGMRDRVLGQVGPRGNESLNLVRAARLFRSYNYTRFLGMQTPSSFNDAGKLIARYGLVKTGRALGKFLTNVHFNNITREDAKRMNTALGWTRDTRGQTLAEIGDDIPTGRAEQFAQWATQRFTRISGMATWNSMLQSLTSILQQDEILRLAQKADLTDFEVGKYAQLGISKANLARIRQQFEKYGEEVEGLARARTELWDDKEAAKLIEHAVVQSADTMITVKGSGELPLFMDKEIFKTLLQFRSFGMASVTRTLIPIAQGIAHGDKASINGAASMLALGAMTYYFREIASGREPDMSPNRVIAESLQWSGFLAYSPDIWDPFAKMMNAPTFSRFSDRSLTESFSGPTFGTVNELGLALQDITAPAAEAIGADVDGAVTASDIHQFRKLLPLQNVFWFRRVVNGLEGELAEGIGAEGAKTDNFIGRVTETEKVN